MTTAAIVQARMTSTRLPGKVMMPILGRPMLELLIERLRRARNLDKIIIATTTNSTDDMIVHLCEQLGIDYFRGSESDVLNRYLGAAHSFGVDTIVRITSDCPLIEPEVVDQLVALRRESGVDYVSNTIERTFPRGLDAEVFTTASLERVAERSDDNADHEHVTLHIYEHPDDFSLKNLSSGLAPEHASLRLTVDTPEDFTLVQEIYEELYPLNPAFGLDAVIALLKRRPELAEINREIQQKASHP